MGYRSRYRQSDYYRGFGRWAPYVPVAKRRANAAAEAKKLEKKRGKPLAPVNVKGLAIAKTFWGKSWCENLELYSDFANRLPRGRTYVRNGSVIDLQISGGQITALVSGSEIYTVKISIEALSPKMWKAILKDCSESIGSLMDLLQGRFDQGVMERLTCSKRGLFPKPKEIKMSCSCPDWAGLCKHIAATMYGVGARLDESPELMFDLRQVDHLELICQAADADNLEQVLAGSSAEALGDEDLGQMFGIELESSSPVAAAAKRVKVKTSKPRKRRATPRKTKD